MEQHVVTIVIPGGGVFTYPMNSKIPGLDDYAEEYVKDAIKKLRRDVGRAEMPDQMTIVYNRVREEGQRVD